MSVHLMSLTKVFVRNLFTRQQLISVEYYGGEFSSEEVGKSSYKTPAVLIACLGWKPPTGRERVDHPDAKVVHMAAFLVTGGSDREARMLEAQGLAELLDLGLKAWSMVDVQGKPVDVASPEPGIRCENVYNRKIDAQGQALWLVSWRQCVVPARPPAEMFDLLGLDIYSTVRQVEGADAEPGDVLPVRHEVTFTN